MVHAFFLRVSARLSVVKPSIGLMYAVKLWGFALEVEDGFGVHVRQPFGKR